MAVSAESLDSLANWAGKFNRKTLHVENPEQEVQFQCGRLSPTVNVHVVVMVNLTFCA